MLRNIIVFSTKRSKNWIKEFIFQTLSRNTCLPQMIGPGIWLFRIRQFTNNFFVHKRSLLLFIETKPVPQEINTL